MTRQSRNRKSSLGLRRIDPKGAIYTTTLMVLIVLPSLLAGLTGSTSQFDLAKIVLLVVLANTIAQTLTETVTLSIQLLRQYNKSLAFQFSGYLAMLLMAMYSYYIWLIAPVLQKQAHLQRSTIHNFTSP